LVHITLSLNKALSKLRVALVKLVQNVQMLVEQVVKLQVRVKSSRVSLKRFKYVLEAINIEECGVYCLVNEIRVPLANFVYV